MDQEKHVLEQLEQFKAMGVDVQTLQSLVQTTYAGGTTDIGLNQWSLNDKPTMEDFNRDNAIIDQKLRELEQELSNKANEVNSLEQLGLTLNSMTIQKIHENLPPWHSFAVYIGKAEPYDPLPYGYGVLIAKKCGQLVTCFQFIANDYRAEWRGTYFEVGSYGWSGWRRVVVD